MDAKKMINKHKMPKHPQENSNILSDLFFCWTIPLFRKGLKKELSQEDIYQTLKRHDANGLVKRFEKAWNDQKYHNVEPSLWKAIWKIFKWDIIVSMCLYFFLDFIVR
jgi:ATP-binding cassette subfamily C (CFTR/MRP) protein 4